MKDSNTEWAHHSFNPWWGCAKVSAGCDNCYATSKTSNYGYNFWDSDAPRRTLSHATWDKPLIWNNEALEAGIRKRVFCSPMADVFERRPDLIHPRQRLLTLIGATTNLDWLLLTKRPENIKILAPIDYRYPSNVWLGTSVEDQYSVNNRIKYLLEFKKPKVRFLCCEPLLEALDIRRYLVPNAYGVRIDWVIVGGEYGSRSRPMNPEWVESLREQCLEANVPFLFKQWGDWAVADPYEQFVEEHQIIEFSRQDGTPIQMKKVGKKAAGHLLDDESWAQIPHYDENR